MIQINEMAVIISFTENIVSESCYEAFVKAKDLPSFYNETHYCGFPLSFTQCIIKYSFLHLTSFRNKTLFVYSDWFCVV